MSRQNKVNPGMYTQRGRLTQDDAARELVKQRATGSEHTWQPEQRDHQAWPASNDEDADDDSAADEPVEMPEKKAPRVTAKATRPRATAKAKPAAKARTSARTKANAKAPRLVRRSAKREGGVARKAVLARGAGHGSTLLNAGQKKTKAAATAKRKR